MTCCHTSTSGNTDKLSSCLSSVQQQTGDLGGAKYKEYGYWNHWGKCAAVKKKIQ